MIFTRRFGALRARPIFPSIEEQDVRVEQYDNDVRLQDGRADRTSSESAA
jgi:hypothetical protein